MKDDAMTYLDCLKQSVNVLCSFIIGAMLCSYFNWPKPYWVQTPETIMGTLLGFVVIIPLAHYYINKYYDDKE